MVVDDWSGVLPALSVVVFSLEHGLESFHAVLVLWWALWVDPCIVFERLDCWGRYLGPERGSVLSVGSRQRGEAAVVN